MKFVQPSEYLKKIGFVVIK